MNIIKRTILYLVTAALTIGLVSISYLPASAAVETLQKCTRWHTVQQGEYLSKIAKQYDVSWYALVEINHLSNPSLIYPGTKLCIFHSDFSSTSPTNVPVSSAGTTLIATNVKEDQAVTIQVKNLSANSRYAVYLGKYNADPAYRILVGSVTTDKNGSFKETFDIPKQLYDVLKVRLSITSQCGVSTSNWFYNTTSSAFTGGIGSPELSLAIHSVNKGDWVKVSTKNLPANVSFHVYMNRYGAADKKAIRVGILRDSKGGNIVATFEIPESLKDRSQLEIIAVNDAIEMTAEATFDNKTSK